MCLQKTGPLQLIWYIFTNLQHSLTILAQRDLIQFSIDYVKSFKIGLEPAVWFRWQQ